MNRDSLFEFYGFMTILLIGVTLAYFVLTAFSNPNVLLGLHGINPWLGEHSKPLSWLSTAAVLLTTIVFPPILMRMEFNDGNSRLTIIGMIGWLACLLYSIGWLMWPVVHAIRL